MTDWSADGKLQLAICDMGLACAAALCQQLERSGWLENMALIGWAGGLCPNLATGDSVLADAAMNIHGQRVSLVPPNLPGTKVGALLSAPAPRRAEDKFGSYEISPFTPHDPDKFVKLCTNIMKS